MHINSKANIILLVGGSGLIGRGLIKYLLSQNFQVRILSRVKRNIKDVACYIWDPEKGTMDCTALKDEPIIINLAGESIADKFWTNKRKKDILSSRIKAIKTIEQGLVNSDRRPGVIICASAIGIYGNRPIELLDEESTTTNDDFLSSTVQAWESSARSLHKLCDRFVLIRIGLVLSKNGGIWPKIILAKFFRIFNWFGNGEQIYSWIHLHDLIKAIEFIIKNEKIESIVNLTSPGACTNKEIVSAIVVKVRNKALCFGIPKIILHVLLQDMANLVLHSQKVIPKKLLEMGFTFKFNTISEAVEDLMNKK